MDPDPVASRCAGAIASQRQAEATRAAPAWRQASRAWPPSAARAERAANGGRGRRWQARAKRMPRQRRTKDASTALARNRMPRGTKNQKDAPRDKSQKGCPGGKKGCPDGIQPRQPDPSDADAGEHGYGRCPICLEDYPDRIPLPNPRGGNQQPADGSPRAPGVFTCRHVVCYDCARRPAVDACPLCRAAR